jgi:energy-coupling factor transporter ATP-binding protein EcfA2
VILGILIRDYKCYNNLQFIPIAPDDNNKYTVFIGNNGVGKSTVLESLDTFFNNREWNINKNGRKDDAFVAPIFLIKKDELVDESDNGDVVRLLDAISEYYWKVTDSANPNIKNTPGIQKFLILRDDLLKKGYSQEEYYFLILGIDYNDRVYFSTFNKNITDEIKTVLQLTEEEVMNQLNLLRKFILEQYSYIYIPVEMPISEVLKMQTQQMQTLMNKDILEEIDAVLRERIKIDFEGSTKNLTFIDFINRHLNTFMQDINNTIRLIDESYSYDVEFNKRKNLTPAHIREKILEAYFPIRTLKRNKREIYELSSGEQRKALIDIIFAFLTQKGARDKNIIIAIDEPESSMHVSNCFRQFQRLEELANKYNNQILITTHWYGFMPITNKGSLIHIDSNDVDTDKIKMFDFNNYLEEKRNYPDSVELKSTFDLAIFS